MARPRKKLAARGEKPDLSTKMWKAGELERWAFADAGELSIKPPSARIAEKVGVTRQVIDKWRRNPRYIQGVVWIASQRASDGYGKAHVPKLGDPEEGTKRDGMVYSQGAWQEAETVREEAEL